VLFIVSKIVPDCCVLIFGLAIAAIIFNQNS
jgi:hypothetical protein